MSSPDAGRDIDTIVALFTSEVAAVEERQTYHGTTQIRDWQVGAASNYRYSIERTGEESYLVIGRLTGNFPGGTAGLH